MEAVSVKSERRLLSWAFACGMLIKIPGGNPVLSQYCKTPVLVIGVIRSWIGLEIGNGV